MTVHELVNAVTSGKFDPQLSRISGGELGHLRRRAQLISAAEIFSRLFPLRDDIRVFFAPKVPDIRLKLGSISISAAPAAEVAAVAAFHREGLISLSVGELDGTLDLSSGETTGPLCNVLLDLYADMPDISGFDMVLGSDVPLTDEEIGAAVRAVADCGGGSVIADISRFFAGYSLCVTRVAEASDIPEHTPPDMTAEQFFEKLPELIGRADDAEMARLARYFAKQERAELVDEAVSRGDIAEFFRLVDQADSDVPRVAIGLALSRRLLAGEGASIAGNGCVLAFVPAYAAGNYAEKMSECFGGCSVLDVGGAAAIEI